MDAFLAALATFRTQLIALGTNIYNNAVDCYNNALLAAANANAAVAAANATKWVSGTTYAEGDGRWSPINYQTYRRKTAGAGTTDPSLDGTNWALISVPVWIRKTSAYTALSFDKIKASTTGGAWELTFPASPADGDTIEVQDVDGTFHTASLTLLVNGKKIMGFTTAYVLDTRYAHLIFVYDATLGDWRF
ncbi:MAG: hypothetical protein V1784_03775 [bacterium]